MTFHLDNNLHLQQPLYNLRSETQDAFDEAKSLEARWKELEKEQRDLYQVRSCLIDTSFPSLNASLQRYTPQFLLMRLKHSITAQDDASEALATAFVRPPTSVNPTSGTGTPAPNNEIDDFVKEFKELRKIYHKRVLWAEKWSKGDVVWREDY